MRKLTLSVVVLLASFAACTPSLAQQAIPDEILPGTIAVGTALEDARSILTVAKVPAAGMRQSAAHPDGDQWLFHSLRNGKAELVVQYSLRTKSVTSITVYNIGDPRSKTSDIATFPASITFNRDGSFSLLFSPRDAPQRLSQNTASANLPTGLPLPDVEHVQPFQPTVHTWTRKDGRSVTAAFVRLEEIDGSTFLVISSPNDDREYKMRTEMLSERDQRYARDAQAALMNR